jgi:competence/damage-inducible protein CinA-like protein
MPSAEIITIGTEILLGEIVDTNARHIARRLRDAGIDLYRKTTVGDNPGRIAQAIQQALERCDIVLTTGGLGPTIDDPTREAVAMAVNRQVEFRPELWEQIQARFQRFGRQPTENNRRQAYIPSGAIPIENPVGTAPCFIVELGEKVIISLPGVPREMEYILENSVLPYLRQRYHLTGLIKTRILHTAGVGESQIDDLIGDLEKLSNPTVGLAAHSGQVDVRITAKADSEEKADAMIAVVERRLYERLGDWIYGADQTTLEEVALQALDRRGWSLAVFECGLGGMLINRLSAAAQRLGGRKSAVFRSGEVATKVCNPQELVEMTEACRRNHQVDVCLGAAIFPAGERQEVRFVLVTPNRKEEFYRPYGGPPEYAPRWAVHHGLDILRRIGNAENE